MRIKPISSFEAPITAWHTLRAHYVLLLVSSLVLVPHRIVYTIFCASLSLLHVDVECETALRMSEMRP